MATDKQKSSGMAKLVTEKDGSFKRQESAFRNTIEVGGVHPPEKGRYHLYVAYGCPWATRTIILRKLKGLEDIVGLTVVSPLLGSLGWAFKKADDYPGAEDDPLYGFNHLREFYFKVDPTYQGRITVPMLWDKQRETIVNNESSEIIRIFNTAFNQLLPADKAAIDLYPEELRSEIDSLNEWVYDAVNSGVYKAGFAASQEAYEAAVKPLFDGLDRLETIIRGKNYLIGNRLTEADVRLFTTLIRFDPVYYSHFKCNLGSIRHDYPELNRWTKNLYWNNTVFKDSTNFDHIKTGYYWSMRQINPTGIVPVGPRHDIEPL